MRCTSLLLAWLVAAPAALADDEIVAIRAGRIIPVSSPDIENGVILVKNGRIEAVGRDLEVPWNAAVIDASKRVVSPGWIEPHTWRGLDRPGPMAADQGGGAWVLAQGGQGLFRLVPDGSARQVELPFARGLGVEVDPGSGACWVVGEEEVAALAPDGALLAHWQGIEGGRGLAVDGAQAQVWIATPGFLLRFSMSGELLARLGGFASLSWIELNPGRL